MLIFLWALVSFFVMGVFFWSVSILFQQKKAWAAFAQKMGLSYQKQKGWLQSPIVEGKLGTYDFRLLSEAQQTNDSRGVRYTTVIEFYLRKGIPAIGAIATEKLHPVFDDLVAKQEILLQDPDWKPDWRIRVTDQPVVRAYLTEARLATFKKIFKMSILGAIFIFTGEDAMFRIESSDPLSNAERLEKIVKGVLAQMPSLVADDAEIARLKTLAATAPQAPAEQSAPPV